ncbi:hypothetical protein C0992_007475 [Termitomyces sp. T32_za158]|nr:hypothetical protein C0992_007475 [Termitomyces sp. T32_za158]
MSSPSASTSLVSPAVLAARAYVPKLDMFLASLANVGPGADQKTVVGAMKVFKKWLWHKALAEHLAKRIAEVRAAGFLEVGEEGAASSGNVVETEEAAAGSAVAVVKAVAEPADESEAPEDDNNMDDEVEAPSTPKKVPTVGGSGRPPAVIKWASKSTTPSERRLQKVVPQYEAS